MPSWLRRRRSRRAPCPHPHDRPRRTCDPTAGLPAAPARARLARRLALRERLFIAFAQMGTWADIKFEKNFPSDGAFSREKPIAQVWASQFDWRFRYPGDDGVLGNVDDI